MKGDVVKSFAVACIIVLAVGMLGCRSTSCPPQPAQEAYSRSDKRTYSADVVLFAEIIPALCEELGMTIEEATQSPERHEWSCKSLSGLAVNFEVMAVVTGRSLVRTTVRGDRDLVMAIQQEIGNALYAAAHRREIN